jgi:hypothetical protein
MPTCFAEEGIPSRLGRTLCLARSTMVQLALAIDVEIIDFRENEQDPRRQGV